MQGPRKPLSKLIRGCKIDRISTFWLIGAVTVGRVSCIFFKRKFEQYKMIFYVL